MSPPAPHNLSERLRAWATLTPDAVAVRFPRGTRAGAGWVERTWREVDQGADRVAAGLRAAGFQPGERAALLLRPGPDFHALIFGLFRAGVVPVFVDPGMRPAMALACVGRIAPTGLIGSTLAHVVSFLARAPFASVRRRVTQGVRLGWGGGSLDAWLAAPAPAPEPCAAVRPEDDAVLVFTSGSTGAPKAVSLTHACMAERVDQIQSILGLEPGTIASETLLVYTILELCMGVSVVIPPMDLAKPATVDPAAVIETIAAFQPSLASASPVVWQRLARHAEVRGAAFPSLRQLLTTAAPIPVDLHERLRRVVGAEVELFTPYGATEAMPIALIGSAEILADTAAGTARGDGVCVGRTAPGLDVRLLRVTDAPLPTWTDDLLAPDGEIGEIAVAGPGVSAAYRDGERGNQHAKIPLPDGRTLHRMGDLGWRDARGRLWFCGRMSHRLQTAHGLVPNAPIEAVAAAHPDVYRAALIGLGPVGAERPILLVEMEPGRAFTADTEAALRRLLDATRWAGVVASIEAHAGFPTDTRHNSKIRNEDLKAEAERRAALRPA
jgi:acyl-CoA synthetase (AMP-forming)/AMP-acid ligase II